MLKSGTLTGLAALGLLTTACSGGAETDSPQATDQAEETAADDSQSQENVAEYASLTGDPTSGKKAFMQCRTCHVTDEGQNRVGPTLHNIVGAKAGAVSGFNYSPANANSGITWTEEQLFEYLKDPQAVIPKTKMIYGGMADAQQRADLIAYLKDPS